jgi:hypothetical protein
MGGLLLVIGYLLGRDSFVISYWLVVDDEKQRITKESLPNKNSPNPPVNGGDHKRIPTQRISTQRIPTQRIPTQQPPPQPPRQRGGQPTNNKQQSTMNQ